MLTRLANGDILLQLHVQPGASRDQFLGLHGDAIKVAIKWCSKDSHHSRKDVI